MTVNIPKAFFFQSSNISWQHNRLFFFSSREKDNFGVLCVDLIMVVIARTI